MSKFSSKQQLVRNETKFRRGNEKARRVLSKLVTDDEPIRFLCECSDPACRDHIALTCKDYKKLHPTNRHFVVKPGHEKPEVDRIAEKGENFEIVENMLLKNAAEQPAST